MILRLRYLAPCLFVFTPLAAFGQTPPAPKSVAKTAPAAPNPDLDKYNKAVNDFNKATQDLNAAKRAGDAGKISAANAEVSGDITELQTVSALPSYAKDTASQATLHNLLGYLYLTQDNGAAAIPELQRTVDLNPANLDARNNLGNALRQAGRFDDSAAQYRYILDHPAATPSPSLDPAKIKFNLATVLGQAGHTDEALALYSELTAGGAGDAVTYKNEGYFLQKAGRTADAADALQKSATLNPKDAGAWLNAGELYAHVGSQDQAIAALTKAVGPDVDPKLDVKGQYDAHFALGEAYAAKGDNNGAIKEFDTAATLQPANSVPLYNKGVLQEQAGLKADAESSYQAALKDDPNSVQVQSALGLLLADEGKNAQSAPVLSQAASGMPQDSKAAPVYARLGDVYAQLKDYPNANRARLEALALSPDDADTHVALADSYMAQRQYVSALVQYNAAATLRPQDAAIQNGRGVAYKSLRQYPKALAAFKRASALSPRSAQMQNNVGVVYELLGSRAQAIVAYKKALALDPGLAVARVNLNRFATK